MKIICIDKEIKEVFETGYFVIPRFQRPYSWDKENIEDFWNDIVIENDKEYFIGSIVVFKIKNDEFGIVDGQQRLTTITMIFALLRNYYNFYNFSNQARGIHNFIERRDFDNNLNYVLQPESSYPYFQEKIQSFETPTDFVDELKEEEEKLKEAFTLLKAFFNKEFSKIDKDKTLSAEKKGKNALNFLNSVRDKLLRLKLIYIALDNEDDAYLIFETLNTRGKDLGASDLVKNHLTKLLKISNKGVDRPKDKWYIIKDTVESISTVDLSVDDFLYHLWLSKYEFSTLKNLFINLKKRINKNNAKQFLDDLIIDSKTYKIIFEPSAKNWNKDNVVIYSPLEALSDFRITQQTPLVLSIMRKYFNGSMKTKITSEMIQTIEHFHFVHTIIGQQRSSGGISKMYSVAARQLVTIDDPQLQANLYKELKAKLLSRMPSYEEFSLSFKNLDYSNDFKKYKVAIKYILVKVSKFFNKNSALTVNFGGMSIEHILSQNHSKPTASSKVASSSIGNLILVDPTFNEKLGNRDFDKKKMVILSSNLSVDDILRSAVDWDEKSINERTEFLADLCYNKVFKL